MQVALGDGLKARQDKQNGGKKGAKCDRHRGEQYEIVDMPCRSVQIKTLGRVRSRTEKKKGY